MKVGIAFAVALLVAVVAFFGLRDVLSDDSAAQAADDAADAFEGDGAELGDRLDEEGIDVSGEESFSEGEWEVELEEPREPEEDGETAMTEVQGEASVELPATVGEAERELLVYGGETEATVPFTVTLELGSGDDGWEAESATIEDPYPRAPEAEEAQLESARAIAEQAADAALGLARPGVYSQPAVYATPETAPKQELIEARSANDQSYPPYLVSIPGSSLITGPVDRALVLALDGCEYTTAVSNLRGSVDPAEATDPPGHLQIAEFTGSAVIKPNDIDCRRGRPPASTLSPVAFRVQAVRSRLGADSTWHVTRLGLQFPITSGSSEARDVYNVAPEVVGDERSAGEFMSGSD